MFFRQNNIIPVYIIYVRVVTTGKERLLKHNFSILEKKTKISYQLFCVINTFFPHFTLRFHWRYTGVDILFDLRFHSAKSHVLNTFGYIFEIFSIVFIGFFFNRSAIRAAYVPKSLSGSSEVKKVLVIQRCVFLISYVSTFCPRRTRRVLIRVTPQSQWREIVGTWHVFLFSHRTFLYRRRYLRKTFI